MRAHGIVRDYEAAATKPRTSCSCPDLEHVCPSRLWLVSKLFYSRKKSGLYALLFNLYTCQSIVFNAGSECLKEKMHLVFSIVVFLYTKPNRYMYSNKFNVRNTSINLVTLSAPHAYLCHSQPLPVRTGLVLIIGSQRR